jgi:hypothetical protein
MAEAHSSDHSLFWEIVIPRDGQEPLRGHAWIAQGKERRPMLSRCHEAIALTACPVRMLQSQPSAIFGRVRILAHAKEKQGQGDDYEQREGDFISPTQSHEAVSACDAMVERMNRSKQSPAAQQPAVR